MKTTSVSIGSKLSDGFKKYCCSPDDPSYYGQSLSLGIAAIQKVDDLK